MPEATTDTIDGAAVPLSYRTARTIGFVLNPLVYPPLVIAAVLLHFGAPREEVTRTAALFFLFFSVLPGVHLLWLLRAGRISSLEVHERRGRYRPLALAIGANAVAFIVIPGFATTIPVTVAALIVCQFLNTALIAAITLRWKISIHTASTAGFVAVLYFFAVVEWPLDQMVPGRLVLEPNAVLWLALLVPLLMWARVRARVHSPAQVSAGALLGALLSLLELAILHQMGLLAS